MSTNYEKKDIPLFKVFMAESVLDKIGKVLYSGFIGEGSQVCAFETMIGQYVGHDQILTLSSGTMGLQLAYHIAIDHDPKAEIITTPVTCTATNTPIITNHAKLVWSDVDPLTGNISADDILNKITRNTKAIVMVHWGGNPCDIKKINDIASERNILVVEDAAHALGSTYLGKPLGNYSDFVLHSLQAIKHVTSIDGGILICRSKKHHKRAKLLRWFGIDREHKEGLDLRCEIDVEEAGYKGHMNDVCASVGMENFKYLQEILKKHRDNAHYYNEVFSDTHVRFAPENSDGESAYWLYTIHVENRDELMRKLKEYGIASSKVHSRNDTHSMFKNYKTDLPNTEEFNRTHLCIPVGWWVSKEDREYIAHKVLKYAK